MTRSKKLMLNTSTSLVYQFITIVCGFVLPRMFLTAYGSEVNGLVSSISQFLGFISLCELGVGSVVQSALYKPLADNDINEVSKIVKSSENFFKRIAWILVCYTISMMVFYPYVIDNSFDCLYTIVLIFVIAISTFAQYYFGMTYRLLLGADQLGFVYYTVHSITLLLNTLVCVILIKNQLSIHFVKLSTSVIFLLQPLVIAYVAKKRYTIDRNIELTTEPIKQKWNGLSQHIATVILNNTDTVVLTLFSTLGNVSIYAVYHLVVNGVKQIILSLTNGIQAMMGNMLAKKEYEKLNLTFEMYEWIMHTLVTIAFTVTGILIMPFVRVYTSGVNDVNYVVPGFAIMIVLAQASYCLRLPYNVMVLAAGHYKQTQTSAIVEAAINVILSIVMVFTFGLIGVAIGTFVAMMYRTCYFALYLQKNIINRKIKFYLKHILVDVVSAVLIVSFVFGFDEFYKMARQSYVEWIILAIKVFVTTVVFSLALNGIFYGGYLKRLLKNCLKIR